MNVLNRIMHTAMFPGTSSSYDLCSFDNFLLLPLETALGIHKSELLEFKIRNSTTFSCIPVPCVIIPYFPSSPYLVIHAHGNGTDLGSVHERLVAISEHIKCHMFCFDYPGYGCYEFYDKKKNCLERQNNGNGATPIVADEVLVDKCLERVVAFALENLHWPIENIILFGSSIGTGPCTRLCRSIALKQSLLNHIVAATTLPHVISSRFNRNIGGLILQCPYRSIQHAAESFVGPLVSRLFVSRTKWNIEQEIKDVTCPILWIHGRKDELFDYRGSEKMFQSHPSAVKMAHLPHEATHLIFDLEVDIIQPIVQFLQKFVSRNASLSPPHPTVMFLLDLHGNRYTSRVKSGKKRGKTIPTSSSETSNRLHDSRQGPGDSNMTDIDIKNSKGVTHSVAVMTAPDAPVTTAIMSGITDFCVGSGESGESAAAAKNHSVADYESPAWIVPLLPPFVLRWSPTIREVVNEWLYCNKEELAKTNESPNTTKRSYRRCGIHCGVSGCGASGCGVSPDAPTDMLVGSRREGIKLNRTLKIPAGIDSTGELLCTSCSGVPAVQGSHDDSCVAVDDRLKELGHLWPVESLREYIKSSLQILLMEAKMQAAMMGFQSLSNDLFIYIVNWVHRFSALRFRHVLGVDLIFRRRLPKRHTANGCVKLGRYSLYGVSLGGLLIRVKEHGGLYFVRIPFSRGHDSQGEPQNCLDSQLSFNCWEVDSNEGEDWLVWPVFSPAFTVVTSLARSLCLMVHTTQSAATRCGLFGSRVEINREFRAETKNTPFWPLRQRRGPRQRSSIVAEGQLRSVVQSGEQSGIVLRKGRTPSAYEMTSGFLTDLSAMVDDVVHDYLSTLDRPRIEYLVTRYHQISSELKGEGFMEHVIGPNWCGKLRKNSIATRRLQRPVATAEHLQMALSEVNEGVTKAAGIADFSGIFRGDVSPPIVGLAASVKERNSRDAKDYKTRSKKNWRVRKLCRHKIKVKKNCRSRRSRRVSNRSPRCYGARFVRKDFESEIQLFGDVSFKKLTVDCINRMLQKDSAGEADNVREHIGKDRRAYIRRCDFWDKWRGGYTTILSHPAAHLSLCKPEITCAPPHAALDSLWRLVSALAPQLTENTALRGLQLKKRRFQADFNFKLSFSAMLARRLLCIFRKCSVDAETGSRNCAIAEVLGETKRVSDGSWPSFKWEMGEISTTTEICRTSDLCVDDPSNKMEKIIGGADEMSDIISSPVRRHAAAAAFLGCAPAFPQLNSQNSYTEWSSQDATDARSKATRDLPSHIVFRTTSTRNSAGNINLDIARPRTPELSASVAANYPGVSDGLVRLLDELRFETLRLRRKNSGHRKWRPMHLRRTTKVAKKCRRTIFSPLQDLLTDSFFLRHYSIDVPTRCIGSPRTDIMWESGLEQCTAISQMGVALERLLAVVLDIQQNVSGPFDGP